MILWKHLKSDTIDEDVCHERPEEVQSGVQAEDRPADDKSRGGFPKAVTLRETLEGLMIPEQLSEAQRLEGQGFMVR